MTNTAAVAVKNLSKTYPEAFPRLKKFFRLPVKPPARALKNVSFEIAEGEIFGLIGRNGAGKTTLAKIIATLVRPTAGSVSVKGLDSVREEVGVRSLVGLATAEERSFYWRLTAGQNMLFFARLYGMRDGAARGRIKEIFEKVNLTAVADRRFAELSTGNKQRLAVARALLPAPPVLLLDEPTRSLDPLAAASLRELLASLDNVSILLTSHNLGEIEELCDRVAVLSGGEIRALDTPENLRLRHRPTQQVRISLDGISEEKLSENLPAGLRNPRIEISGGALRLAFSREADDRLLGEAVSFLARSGARILDVETEKPTLLDVLESYQ